MRTLSSWREDVEKAYLSKLNGHIVRLQGNHDPKGWGADYQTVKCNKVKVVLFHYPIEEWDGWWRGSGERRGNVGVDSTNFFPMRLDEAVARLTENSV